MTGSFMASGIYIWCPNCDRFIGSLVVEDGPKTVINRREVMRFLNVNHIFPLCPKCHTAFYDEGLEQIMVNRDATRNLNPNPFVIPLPSGVIKMKQEAGEGV